VKADVALRHPVLPDGAIYRRLGVFFYNTVTKNGDLRQVANWALFSQRSRKLGSFGPQRRDLGDFCCRRAIKENFCSI